MSGNKMPSIETDAQWLKVLFPIIKEAWDKRVEKLDWELTEEEAAREAEADHIIDTYPGY
jgi:hypothetical protein